MVRYPLNSPLGRFGLDTSEDGPQGCVASIPAGGMVNPITGAPTIAPLAMLVDHVGGLINHRHRTPREWTVSSELSMEVTPNAEHLIAARPDVPVVGRSRPLGRDSRVALGLCELSIADEIVATATVRSFYVGVPDGLATWPDRPAGSLPGPALADLMAVQIGETGGAATVLMQANDPVLNNAVGTVHGGVSSIGLELVASAALNSAGAEPGLRTASLRVNFLRPFHGGLTAHYLATPLHVGRSSGVAEAQAIGDDGRIALVARLTAYR